MMAMVRIGRTPFPGNSLGSGADYSAIDSEPLDEIRLVWLTGVTIASTPDGPPPALPAVLTRHGVQPHCWTNSLLKNSTGCVIARMRSQNNDTSRYFASRAEVRSAPGEVEKCQEGIFQRTANPAVAHPENRGRFAAPIFGGRTAAKTPIHRREPE
jgi:hypothetical protein